MVGKTISHYEIIDRHKAPGRPQSHGPSRGESGVVPPVLSKNKEGPDPS